MNKNPTLKEALSFYDKQIPLRFQRLYSYPLPFCEEVFHDTKMFLWAAERYRKKYKKIFPVMCVNKVIDDMWHNFILFTREYIEYCENIYGHYLHHSPAREGEPSIPNEEVKTVLGYIYDEFGSDVVTKWYNTWAELTPTSSLP